MSDGAVHGLAALPAALQTKIPRMDWSRES